MRPRIKLTVLVATGKPDQPHSDQPVIVKDRLHTEISKMFNHISHKR